MVESIRPVLCPWTGGLVRICSWKRAAVEMGVCLLTGVEDEGIHVARVHPDLVPGPEHSRGCHGRCRGQRVRAAPSNDET